jgi:hypothetical protein
MAERLKAHAWKVCIPQKGIVGSNPTPSAIKSMIRSRLFSAEGVSARVAHLYTHLRCGAGLARDHPGHSDSIAQALSRSKDDVGGLDDKP